jgi:hypothetical protein
MQYRALLCSFLLIAGCSSDESTAVATDTTVSDVAQTQDTSTHDSAQVGPTDVGPTDVAASASVPDTTTDAGALEHVAVADLGDDGLGCTITSVKEGHKFGALLVPSYPSRLDRAVLMVLSQHVWDAAETAAWLGAAEEGLEVAAGPVTGSAFVSFNVGDSPVPEGNMSPENDDGGHGAVAFYPAAAEMIVNVLFSGQVTDTCSGECDFTE